MRLRIPVLLAAASIVAAQDFPLARGWEHRDRQTMANPTGVVAGDFNGDGRADLALVSGDTNTVLVYLAADTPMSWREPAAYDTGLRPASIVTGDFNGDGIADLAAGCSTGITILLGQGDGDFKPAPVYSQGAPVTGLVAGDFNGDGLSDLAAILAGTVSVSVSFGSGFEIAWSRPITGDVRDLIAADLNNDRKLDLALVQNAAVLLWPGKGDGTLEEPLRIGAVGVSGICAVDLNNDSLTDLVTGGFESLFSPATPVLFYAGKAGGGFEDPVSIHAGGGRVVAGDFNGDGITDVIAYTTLVFPGERVDFTWIRGGTFRSQLLDLIVQTSPNVIVAADLDGDSRAELLIIDSAADLLLSARGPGGGEFETAAIGSSERLASVAAADFNRDGRADIAVINDSAREVWVFQSGRGGTYARTLTEKVAGSEPIYAARVATGDFDGDGNNDFVITDTAGVRLFAGDGTGAWTAQPAAARGVPTWFAAAADLNGDRIDDLVLPSKVLLGSRTRTFSEPLTVDLGRVPVGGTIAFADMNLDGKLDIIAATLDALNLAIGNGNATFQVPWSFNLSPEPRPEVAVGDFDGDGRTDAVASNVNGLWFFRGRTDGSFADRVAIPNWVRPPCFGCAARFLHAADFNRDGKLDLMVVTYAGLVFLAGVGDGSFRAPVSLALAQPVLASAMADLDGDGIPDLVITHPGAMVTHLSRRP